MDVRGYTDMDVMGATRDDAAGECFDKTARVLGLGYPGGRPVDELSRGGDDRRYALPIAHVEGRPYDMSFSGLKTAVINIVHHAEQTGEPLDKPSLCASFARHQRVADRERGYGRLVAAGGVAANSRIRADLESAAAAAGVRLFIPPL